MQVIYKSKRYIFKNLFVIGLFIVLLTGCQKNQNSMSFESLISVDKTVNSVSNKEEAKELYKETNEIEENKANNLYDDFDKNNKKEYYTELDKLTKTPETNGESFAQVLFVETHGIYTQFKLYAPLICFVSMFLGAIIFLFARGNKAARKYGLVGLVIVVPLLTLFLVYGIGFFYGIFVY